MKAKKIFRKYSELLFPLFCLGCAAWDFAAGTVRMFVDVMMLIYGLGSIAFFIAGQCGGSRRGECD